jgi:hypothetical protein
MPTLTNVLNQNKTKRASNGGLISRPNDTENELIQTKRNYLTVKRGTIIQIDLRKTVTKKNRKIYSIFQFSFVLKTLTATSIVIIDFYNVYIPQSKPFQCCH